MRSFLPDFSVYTPVDLKDALAALASGEKVVPLAGGTDVMVYMEAGTMPPCTFLNLRGVKELAGPPAMNGALTLKALTTYRDVRADKALAARYPMLPLAAREVGVLAIQSAGTWAGNIANASPAADGVPALMAYDAEVELTSVRGTRRVALAKFYTGYKKMDRKADELISAIHLPARNPAQKEYYRKVGTRRFQAISKTLLAGVIVPGANGIVADCRLVFASVAAHTLRAEKTEAVIRGRALTQAVIAEALKALQDEIKPLDDIRSTERYRRIVSGNLLREFLDQNRAE